MISQHNCANCPPPSPLPGGAFGVGTGRPPEGGPGPVKRLQKRAKRRSIAYAKSLGLLDYAKRTGSPLAHAYLRTLKCTNVVMQEDGKVTARYCGNRWCEVCSAIRTARLINAYAPTLDSWPERHMLTLTLPNVVNTALRSTARTMTRTLHECRRVLRRRGVEVAGIRVLEVTRNGETNTWHPHFHVVVSNKAAAVALLEEWLRRVPNARRVAQDVRPATDARELFKYVTKLVTVRNGERVAVSPAEHDALYRAIRGLRTVQSFGFTAPSVAASDGEMTELVASTDAPDARPELVVWEWAPTLHDWVDYTTGAVLSGYEPSPGHLRLLQLIDAAGRADAG